MMTDDQSPAKRLKTMDDRLSTGSSSSSSAEHDFQELEAIAQRTVQNSGNMTKEDADRMFNQVAQLVERLGQGRHVQQASESKIKELEGIVNEYKNLDRRDQQSMVDAFMRFASLMGQDPSPEFKDLLRKPAPEVTWNDFMRKGGYEIMSKAFSSSMGK